MNTTGSTHPWVSAIAVAANPVGQLWVRALQMTVIPLVITHLLSAIVGADRERPIGALGAKALFLFVGMLIAAGLFAIIVASPLVSLYSVDPETASSLRASTSVPASARQRGRVIPRSGSGCEAGGRPCARGWDPCCACAI